MDDDDKRGIKAVSECRSPAEWLLLGALLAGADIDLRAFNKLRPAAEAAKAKRKNPSIVGAVRWALGLTGDTDGGVLADVQADRIAEKERLEEWLDGIRRKAATIRTIDQARRP